MSSAAPFLRVGIPVLGRPQNAATVFESILETAPDADILFLCSPGDDAEIEACQALAGAKVEVMSFAPGRGDFSLKHNRGYKSAVAEEFDWYFVGADDLRFHPGWFEACLAAHDQTGACVIGTRDLGNARTMNGWHSTHFLVHTDYAECGTVDRKDVIFTESYHHEFVDDEFIATARWRKTYATSQAVVEHLHPDWNKAEWDDTYSKAQLHRGEDQALYNQRRHMFASGARR